MVILDLHEFNAMGKALYGMKILGGTDPHACKSRIRGARIDASLRFALSRAYLCGLTIGVSHCRGLDDLIQRIERVAAVPPAPADRDECR